MRVIGGLARGVPLQGPPGPATRATSDKVRGAIFDVLAADLAAARVLDLYAGTGALGIEALSRGAASCLFVERARAVCRVIESNLRTTRLEATALVWRSPVAVALDRLERGGNGVDGVDGVDGVGRVGSTFGPPYDVILLDPPYSDPGIGDVLARLSRSGLVAQDGLVVLEHDKRWPPPPAPGVLRLRRARLYGDTGVTLWQREESERAEEAEG